MSENNEIILPKPPDYTDIDLSPYLLSAANRYEEPHYLLEYQGVQFSPLGGIQAMSGHKKQGKTFVLAQLMAAILAPDSEQVRSKLPGLRLCESTRDWLGHDPSVLYIDTEMEQLNSAKVMRRVHYLCDWKMDEDNQRFKVLWLRGIISNKERRRVALTAIDMLQPTAVFLDGIRDIVCDFNDNSESADIINTLMAKATEMNCCIWNALHYNPRPGDDSDGKMRGHLGTELGNKVTDTFAVSKKKTANGVVFNVTQVDARNKDVPDWSFEVVDDAGRLGIPRMCNAPQPEPNAKSKASITQLNDTTSALHEILPNGKALPYAEIKKALQEYYAIGEHAASRRLNAAREAGIIMRLDGDFKWFMACTTTNNNDKTKNNELPFDKNNDEAPF